MSTPAELALAANAPADAAVDAATVVTPAPAEEVKPQKSPADLQRDAIYARAQAKRGETGDASEEAMRVGVQTLLGTGETPAEPVAPVATAPAPAPAPANNSAPAPIAPNIEMVTLTIEGREIAVPATDVWKHGVAAMQKQSTADARLQRATNAERAIAVERAALDRRAAEIEAQRLPANAGAASPGATADLPTGGRVSTRAAAKQALDALLDSDTEKAAETLERVIAEQVDAGLKRAAPAPAPAPAASVSEIKAPWSAKEQADANLLFETAFPQVLANQTALAQASARMKQEMDNPVNRMGRVDLMILARQVGNEMLQRLPQAPAPVAPSAPNSDALAARRQLAARIPAVPGNPGGRSVNPAPAPAVPTRSEVVQQMRKARGM